MARSTRSLAAALAVAAALSGCGDKVAERKAFVGTWVSTRTNTPILMRENGEWEIATEEGRVLQYGVWQYRDKSLMWSYKLDDKVGHEWNPVLTVARESFSVRETDGSVTLFSRVVGQGEAK